MPTVVQLTTRSKSRVPSSELRPRTDRPGAELGGQRLRLLGGAVPDRTEAPAPTSAQTTARAEPPAPSTSARLPAGGSGRASRKPVASVFSARIRPSAKLSVFAAPISARRRGGLVGELERGHLVRDGDVRPHEALARHRPDALLEILGRDLDRLVRPLRCRPARPEPRCASPASGSARSAGRGRPAACRAVKPRAVRGRRRVAPVGRARLVVGGLGLLELGLAGGERVLGPAGVRLHDVVEVDACGGVGRRLRSRQGPGLPIGAGRQARCWCTCCTASRAGGRTAQRLRVVVGREADRGVDLERHARRGGGCRSPRRPACAPSAPATSRSIIEAMIRTS